MKLIKLLPVLLLVGCSSVPIETKIITQPVEIEVYQPPLPYALNLELPYFYVVTEERLPNFLKNIKTIQQGAPVFIAITPQDYEKLAMNLQEQKRYRTELMDIVKYYRKVTQPDSWEEGNESTRNKNLKPSTTTTFEQSPSMLEKLLKWWK